MMINLHSGKMKKIILMVVMLVLGLNAVAQEDNCETLYLHNGEVVKGKITAYQPKSHVVMETNDGRVVRYDMSEVEHIQRRQASDNVAFSGDFNGKGPQKGYRGFVDGQIAIASGKYGFSRYGVSTTHGYQFSPWFFAGVGYEYYLFKEQLDQNFSTHTIFGDVHLDFLKSNYTPFFDLRAGYNTGKNMGMMVSPSAGVRIALGKRSPLALNLGVGYSLQWCHVYYYEKWMNTAGYSLRNMEESSLEGSIDIGNQTSGGFTVRVGLEF